MHAWSVVPLFVLLVGCGCSSSRDCDWNQVCEGQSCQDIFGRKFHFTVKSASVDWDGGGDTAAYVAPDLYVVLDLDGERCVTPTLEDTFNPQWNYACDLVVNEGGLLSVWMYDEDWLDDELMLYNSLEGKDLARAVRNGRLFLTADSAELEIAIKPHI